MATNELANAIAQLDAYLAQNKLRRTEERHKILAHILSYDGHFTAQTLYADMNKEFRVSLGTVYNTLELFTKLNIIVRHQFTNEIVEYERFSSNLTHHHRICTVCGSVKEFSDLKIRRAVTNRTFSSFETSHFSLYIYGVCKKCQRKSRIKQK